MIERTAMISPFFGFFCFAGFLFCSHTPAVARQFSADLFIARNGAAASVAKLRVLNDKVRIETPDFPDGFFVSDGSNRVSYFARPNAHLFMEARQSSWLVPMFVPVDPEDPCQQWRSMAKVAGAAVQDGQWRCERAGEEIIDGRQTLRYRIIPSPGRETFGWVDRDLKFPLKIQREDGTTADVANIREAPQQAPLFEIPTGFRKFDPEALIRRIKQSDVWVEEPRR
jgi:hypothetical protein